MTVHPFLHAFIHAFITLSVPRILISTYIFIPYELVPLPFLSFFWFGVGASIHPSTVCVVCLCVCVFPNLRQSLFFLGCGGGGDDGGVIS